MKFKEHDILLTPDDEILLVIGILGIGICLTEYILLFNNAIYLVEKDKTERDCVKIGVL